MTTDEDEANECEDEKEPNEMSKTENGCEAESEPDDDITSRFRLPLPLDLIEEAEKAIESHKDDTGGTITKDSLSTPNEDDILIDSDAIADSVLTLFQSYGLNPANLSDEQIQEFIKLVVKERLQPRDTSKVLNGRAGSVETQNSSDSIDSWRLV